MMRQETSPAIPQSTDGLLRTVEASLPAPRSGMPRGLLREHWYVAAFGSEITREPIRRVLLDDPVVLYRKTDGGIVALYDRCAHRSYPLSRGTLQGDDIVCGYHGFVFDPCGTCVAVPGQDTIPKAARVRAYPVVESGPFVWIWMGEGEGDPAKIPDHRWACDPAWATFVNKALVNVRYGLLVDNLLDLSHETYIHAKTIGTPDVAQTPITTEVEGMTVKVSRKMLAAECPPFYQTATGITSRIDRGQDITYHVPAFYVLHVRIAETGDPGEGFHVKIMYALTPETSTTTHDFWALSRNFAVDQAWVTEKMAQIQDAIVNEDVVALEALEKTLPLDGLVPEVSINIDRGGLQARRLIHNLLRGAHDA
ncbi:MAG TPA: aromatic ring-hydroxylating dioxygenase subunit alpha [Candidatus Limnocylindria bacterium]|jgi:phenylpropionate dioxygenase-like ring-hydroxylating dioxygenase large terminal subunit|nr:aromatic ring-hydroxylating dioxygenase subunit alpha [Candidatus Limnocylindria bacterium]